jgi:hypothetical protein
MALAILVQDGVNVIYIPAYDLEFVLYIFCHLCTSCSGPKGMSWPPPTRSVPLLGWFHDGTSYQGLAHTKAGQIADYKMNIVDHFMLYFISLKPTMSQLFQQAFPFGLLRFAPKPKLTHSSMIAVNNHAIKILKRGGSNSVAEIPCMPLPEVTCANSHAQKQGPMYPTSTKNRSTSKVAEMSGQPSHLWRVHQCIGFCQSS